MRPVERQFEFTVSAAREEVFALLSDARNLNLVTPEWFAFEILSERPGEMHAGALIEYRLKYRLLKMRWRSRVTEWDPPHRFIYQQATGPFRFFRHEHLFTEEDGGTRVVDNVRYAAPGGRLVDRLMVAADLCRIFSFREAKVNELLAAEESPSVRQVAVAD